MEWALPAPPGSPHRAAQLTLPARPTPPRRPAAEAKDAMSEAQQVYGATFEQPAEDVAAQ